MIKGYLTTAEAAERLGVSTTRIRQMILEGVIKGATKVGQNNLIPEKEVKRLETTERKAGRPATKKGSDVKAR